MSTSASDVGAFYAALGIELAGWARREAPARCFANADAHNHGDRSASCSVNLDTGAWNCHGCGAAGGAYDAALAVGHTPRSAIDLMIAHGLVRRRTHGRLAITESHGHLNATRDAVAPPVRRPRLFADEHDVRQWHQALDADGRLTRRLLLERAWSSRAIRELELGWDGARITIPIRSSNGRLRGVLRYDPFGQRQPKMRAMRGTRLGLVPHPAQETSTEIVLVEGPPDMIAARSCGLATLAVPSTTAWHPSWAQLLIGRHVTIVMDCDTPGRRAADTIARSLKPVASSVAIADLCPGRHDGYDLTDRILERRATVKARAPRTLGALLAPSPFDRPHRRTRNGDQIEIGSDAPDAAREGDLRRVAGGGG
jgi:hypothetical protein